MRDRAVNYFAVATHHFGPPLAVSFLDRLLDVNDRYIARKHAGNAEKTRLHYRVYSAAHSLLLRERISVDCEEADLLLDHLLLHLSRVLIPHIFDGPGCVQQKDCARRRVFEDVDLLHELELVAGYEARTINEVGRSDGTRARAQMRNRYRS